jgi:hypothetical protein
LSDILKPTTPTNKSPIGGMLGKRLVISDQAESK